MRVIGSFADKETQRIFEGEPSRRFGELTRAILRKLLQLDAAVRLEELRVPPANRLEPLQGDRQGQYSIRVNRQYRICFEWKEGHAYEVEVVDYD